MQRIHKLLKEYTTFNVKYFIIKLNKIKRGRKKIVIKNRYHPLKMSLNDK